jgi:DNA-damage-inducible protein J
MAITAKTKTKVRLNINIDPDLKEETKKTLDEMGLDATTAITLYFKKINATRSIPFEISAKKYYTVEEVAGEKWREGLDEIEDNWE